MPEPTLLLLGANGQVGHELQRTLLALGRLVALDVPDIDYCKPETLRAAVREIRPQIIINAAAYTAVDKAESEQNIAFAINAVAPGVLAEEAAAHGACLVHYSTDYVFDGRKPSAYVETDQPNPLSVYGKTKLDGECAVGTCPRHIIFRTSWVISAHGHNFVKTILRLAGERDSLRVVSDQVGAPTSAALLAEATANVLTKLVAAPSADPRWSLYHLTAGGETSWHGLAKHAIAHALELGVPLKVKPEAIEPITTNQYPTSAQRPVNSRLDTSKFRVAFRETLPSWTVGVDQVVDELAQGEC